MTSREIAERIEEELAKNNLKKKDFHEKTGITRAAFSLWKNEKAFPSKESLDIINQSSRNRVFPTVCGFAFAVRWQ